jgi:hypothetical protein
MDNTAQVGRKRLPRGVAVAICMFALLTVGLLSATPAFAQGYTFTKVADSAQDGFDPFSFGCVSINAPGDVAFRAGRLAPDGFNVTPGIYRANAGDGSITTIVEDQKRFDFVGRNPSMNDSGQVSFAANLEKGDQAILRGTGKKLTTIASTAKEFNFFGFDTSVNNGGVVAFKAELDPEFDFDEGLFSGSGGKINTHYLASTSDFDGNDSRPAINNLGAIAFDESIDFDSGIFVTSNGGFTVIATPDPDRSVQEPTLNDAGTVAFEVSFTDPATGEFVTAIVTGNGGPLTTVASTQGPFGSFGFRPPSINNDGDVGFLATLDDFVTSAIFVQSAAGTQQVIATGETLNGAVVQSLTFCEEGLSDSGHVAFAATLEDPSVPEGFRVAVFRAAPAA